MEPLSAVSVGGLNGDCDGPVDDGGIPGAIDVHTAARHGTALTIDRLSQIAGVGVEDVRRLRRGPVESTPVHDAAAAGNVDTLTWLLADARTQQLIAVYLSFFICCSFVSYIAACRTPTF